MTKERTGRVWDEVRRTLGRMVGRVTTHGVPEAKAGIAVAVRHPAVIGVAVPGAGQTEWQPTAQVVAPQALTAQPGAHGADLAAVTTVVGIDRALRADDVIVPSIPCVTTQPPIHSLLLGREGVAPPEVQCPAMRFGQEATISPRVTFSSPMVRSLSGVWTLPTKLAAGQGTPRRWQVAAAPVRNGMAAILRTPMTRQRAAPPNDLNPAVAFAAERALLASGAGVPETDVVLIGVFPQVPLWAVQNLSVAPGGVALQIQVRADAAGRRDLPPVVTVILGRQRSTGKTLQAVRRGTQGV